VIVVVLTVNRSNVEGGNYHVLPVRPTLAADRAITSKVAGRTREGGLLLLHREAGRVFAVFISSCKQS
jgi:hypothetical protein